MSRDWTQKELDAASRYMKKLGYMGYEEFVIGLKRADAVLESIRKFNGVQTDGHFPCPRCGKYDMSSNPMRNALSRYADIQICDSCGIDEAMRDFAHSPIPITSWAIAEHPEVYICEGNAQERACKTMD